MGNQDIDIYSFEVLNFLDTLVRIELETNADDPNDFDSVLRLFDTAGNQLAIDDNSGEGAFSQLNVELSAGTYFVGVSSAANSTYDPTSEAGAKAGETGNYSLKLSLESAVPDELPRIDVDGLIANANSVVLGTDRSPLTLTGNLGTDDLSFDANGESGGFTFFIDGDVDFYRFVTPDNGFISIDIDTPVNGQPFPDTLIRIFVDEQPEQDLDGDGVPGEGLIEIAAQDLVGGPDNGLGKVRLDITSILQDAGVLDFFEDVAFPANILEEVPGKGDLVLEDGQPVGHRTDSFVEGEVVRDAIIYVGVSNAENDSYDPNLLDDSRLSNGEDDFSDLDNLPEVGDNEYRLTINFLSADLEGSITQALPANIIDLETFNQRSAFMRSESQIIC